MDTLVQLIFMVCVLAVIIFGLVLDKYQNQIITFFKNLFRR